MNKLTYVCAWVESNTILMSEVLVFRWKETEKACVDKMKAVIVSCKEVSTKWLQDCYKFMIGKSCPLKTAKGK